MKLIGKYGEINVGEKESTAVVTNPVLEQRYGSVVTFSNEKLTEWVKRLKIHSTEDGRIQMRIRD